MSVATSEVFIAGVRTGDAWARLSFFRRMFVRIVAPDVAVSASAASVAARQLGVLGEPGPGMPRASTLGRDWS
jgi:hypothetical protein